MACSTSATWRLSGLLGTMKSTVDGRRNAGLGQQLLGFGHVAPGDRKLLLEVGALGADPLVARQHLAVEYDVRQRLAVDGGLQRLAHARILAEWAVLAGIAVGQIEREALVADLDLGGELELGIGPDLLRSVASARSMSRGCRT